MSLTDVYDLKIIQNDYCIRFHQVLGVVGTDDARLVSQQSHDAPGEDVLSDVRIHCRHGVVKEIDVIVLCKV